MNDKLSMVYNVLVVPTVDITFCNGNDRRWYTSSIASSPNLGINESFSVVISMTESSYMFRAPSINSRWSELLSG